MNSTESNLFTAFAHATQTNRKFISYSEVAELEYHEGCANHFRKTLEAVLYFDISTLKYPLIL